MGYRSQVVLAFDKALLPKFLDVIARSEDTKRLVFEWRESWDKEFEVTCYGEQSDNEGHHCIMWDNIKWYPDEDTRAIENFVSENYENARFLRIGEEYDDSDDYGEFAQCTIEIQRTQSIEFY
tara:strand:+ start:453 stop:821 length:369 start_codon:yes stop_codon:yes gene_type:complete